MSAQNHAHQSGQIFN